LSCAHAQQHFHINGAASAQIGCCGGGCSAGFAWLDNRLVTVGQCGHSAITLISASQPFSVSALQRICCVLDIVCISPLSFLATTTISMLSLLYYAISQCIVYVVAVASNVLSYYFESGGLKNMGRSIRCVRTPYPIRPPSLLEATVRSLIHNMTNAHNDYEYEI
jgi:hypothetical protein